MLHQEMVTEIEHSGHGNVKMTAFPVKMTNNPCRIRLPAPKLGEHTDEVLTELGLDESEIKELRTKGIL